MNCSKPMIFNTKMVRAILEGRKTVTRRVVEFKAGQSPAWSGYIPDGAVLYGSNNIPAAKAPYRPGDILWVRETWNCLPIPEPLRGTNKTYWYKADGAGPEDKWRPSIHMPREAARIFLRVTGVRVERLQEITESGAKAEGAVKSYPYTDPETGETAFMLDEKGTYLSGFSQIWDSTIKPKDLAAYGWDANPWVWVISFERIDKPADWGCTRS